MPSIRKNKSTNRGKIGPSGGSGVVGGGGGEDGGDGGDGWMWGGEGGVSGYHMEGASEGDNLLKNNYSINSTLQRPTNQAALNPLQTPSHTPRLPSVRLAEQESITSSSTDHQASLNDASSVFYHQVCSSSSLFTFVTSLYLIE